MAGRTRLRHRSEHEEHHGQCGDPCEPGMRVEVPEDDADEGDGPKEIEECIAARGG